MNKGANTYDKGEGATQRTEEKKLVRGKKMDGLLHQSPQVRICKASQLVEKMGKAKEREKGLLSEIPAESCHR